MLFLITWSYVTKSTVNAVKCFLLFRCVTSVTQNVTSVTHKDIMYKHLCWMLRSIALTFHTHITYQCCNSTANCHQVRHFTEMLYLIHGVRNYLSLHVTSVTLELPYTGNWLWAVWPPPSNLQLGNWCTFQTWLSDTYYTHIIVPDTTTCIPNYQNRPKLD